MKPHNGLFLLYPYHPIGGIQCVQGESSCPVSSTSRLGTILLCELQGKRLSRWLVIFWNESFIRLVTNELGSLHYKSAVSCNVVVLIESIVLFGGTLLRLAFFLCQQNVSEGKTQVLYSLYGIVEHSGTMRSGHYTAYVKTRPNRQSMAPNGLAMQGRHFNFSVWSGVCYCVRNCMEVQLGNIHPICLWRFRVNLRHRQFSLQCLVHSLTSLDIFWSVKLIQSWNLYFYRTEDSPWEIHFSDGCQSM